MLEHGCDAGMSIVVVHDVSGCAALWPSGLYMFSWPTREATLIN